MVMTGQEKIIQIEEELRQLQKQVASQYNRITDLQRQLRQLKGGTEAAPVPGGKHADAVAQPTLENFIGLRLIHLVGVVVLVIGLSIGVKYAFDRELVSEGARILLAYAAGGALLFFAWRLKQNYGGFSAILFSGAMASLYFTTYAAYTYYALLPFTAAFLVMVLFTVFTAAQAAAYNRPEIALLGLVGAYGIPFLISRNAERAELLFLYILIINLGVLYLLFTKGWKHAGRVAQALTWLLFIGWSAVRFTPAQTGTAWLFMCLFFLLFCFFVATATLYRKKPFTRHDAYQQLLNNAALFIAAVFVRAPNFSDARMALVSGLFALFLAAQSFLYYRYLPRDAYLRTLHLIFALTLAVVFVSFRWDGLLVTLVWLLMAVMVFAGGVYIRSVTMRMAAITLIGFTLLKLVALDSLRFSPVQKVIAYLVLGLLLLVVSFFYQKFRQKLFGNGE